MDNFKLKTKMQAGLGSSYEDYRCVEVIGDAIQTLLKEGFTPSDVAAVLLRGSVVAVEVGEPIEVVHVHARHLYRTGDTMMRYIAEVQPDVLKQFD